MNVSKDEKLYNIFDVGHVGPIQQLIHRAALEHSKNILGVRVNKRVHALAKSEENRPQDKKAGGAPDAWVPENAAFSVERYGEFSEAGMVQQHRLFFHSIDLLLRLCVRINYRID